MDKTAFETRKNDDGTEFILCPVCRRAHMKHPLLKLDPDTWGKNVVLRCRYCKTDYRVNIEITPGGHLVTEAEKTA